MIGAIIGDIVGSRFEFSNWLSTEFSLFTPECEFTDDTICTIAVAYALITGDSFDHSLRLWCLKYPNPMGGYGARFFKWLCDPDSKPYNSFGNGSAMRVSPCAWYYRDDLDQALSMAKLSAQCTHNHPEGIKGALAITEAIWIALNGGDKGDIRTAMSMKYGYDLNTSCDAIREHNSFNETCQVTVPQSLVAFFESEDFESAIRLAVSLGGDSDTLTAITGSIAEAFYGIPEELVEKAFTYLPKAFINILLIFKSNYYEKN